MAIPDHEILFAVRNGDAVRVFQLHEADAQYTFSTTLVDALAPSPSPDVDLDRHVVALPDWLTRPSALHVVVSTGSGLCQAQSFFDDVLEPLLGALGLKRDAYRLLVTDSDQSVAKLGHTLPPDATVVLLSGDGGIVDLLNAVATSAALATRPAIAVLPLGTGNALFHSLHKTAAAADPDASPLVLGLRTLVRGRRAPLPSFAAHFAPGAATVAGRSVSMLTGAIVASYGFHAQLVWESDTPAYRKHGDARFGMAAAALVGEGHAYDAQVTVDGVPLAASTHSYVLATLVSDLQRGFPISPHAVPLDGQLRLVHIGAVGGARTMELMMRAYAGTHIAEPDVTYRPFDSLDILVRETDARWRKVCVDGTIVDVPTGTTVRIRKAKPVLDVVAVTV